MGGKTRALLFVTLPLNKLVTPLPARASGVTTTTVAPPAAAGTAASGQTPSQLPADLMLNVVKDTLRDNAQGKEIGPDNYTAVVRRLGSQEVQLIVCFERYHRPGTVLGGDRVNTTTSTSTLQAILTQAHVTPGAYSGSVQLEAADGSIAVTVPVTVKVRYQHTLWLAFLIGPLVLIGGGAFVYASGKGGSDQALLTKDGIEAVVNWLRDSPIPVALGVGAAVTAFIANTASNPTFGANPNKAFISVLGVTFASFTTALAAGSASYKSRLDAAMSPAGEDPAKAPRP